MASESPGFQFSANAGADLSTKQYLFVKASGVDVVVSAAGGDVTIGVLQNDPLQDQSANVMSDGISKIIMGATVAAGVEVMSDSAGRAIAATATNRALGVTRIGAAIDQAGSVLLYGAPVELNA